MLPPIHCPRHREWADGLKFCEEIAPECNSTWQRLRKLDFGKDTDDLMQWLRRLFEEEPPPTNVNGLWFGLYNPILDDGEPSCRLYVGGASAFDAGSDSNEWVCNLSWLPNGRYAPSHVITELYRSVEAVAENQVRYLGEPFLCHGYLALVVSQWCNGPMCSTLLGNAAVRAVVMGHDSGDFYRMAVLRTK